MSTGLKHQEQYEYWIERMIGHQFFFLIWMVCFFLFSHKGTKILRLIIELDQIVQQGMQKARKLYRENNA